MILHSDSETFEELIEVTAQSLNIPAVFIEKDYWVTYILKRLSNSNFIDTAIFKGGTSLSKAYKLIDRFSEDIDLAIITNGKTGNEIKKLIKEIEKGLLDENFQEVYTPQTSKGSQFRKTVHQYPKIIAGEFGHANENLILELNSFAKPYPYVSKTISSYIYDFLNTQSSEAKQLIDQYSLEPFQINVLDYRRTFCEKISALARASFESDESNTQLKEKIRHFYDIYFLMQEDEIKEFINNNGIVQMIKDVRNDDQEQFGTQWTNEKLHLTNIFRNTDTLDKLDTYYQTNFQTLVYGTLPTINQIQNELINISKILKKEDL